VNDSAHLERLRDQAWALMVDAGRQIYSSQGTAAPGLGGLGPFSDRELVSRSGRMRPVALVVLRTAEISLLYEMAAKDWRRAVLAGYSMSLAVSTLAAGLAPAEFRDLAAVLKRIPDLAAYACHKADFPQAATMILETVTSLLLDDRMMERSAQAYAERPSAVPDMERLLSQQCELIAASSAPHVTQEAGTLGTCTPFDEFAAVFNAGIREDLARLAATAGDSGHLAPASAYLLNSAPTQAFVTAALSHRDLIYVVAAHHGGAAFRVPASGEPLIESIELPRLTLAAVAELTARISALAHMSSCGHGESGQPMSTRYSTTLVRRFGYPFSKRGRLSAATPSPLSLSAKPLS
jgi:hypothetical protein